MKRCLFLLVATCPVVALAAPFEFSGYAVVEGKARVVVTDLADHQSSGWIAIGASFRGYSVSAFEPKNDVLILKRETEIVRLRLKDSKILAAKEEPDPPPATHYALKAGDTGAKIAAANGLTLAELSALNPDLNWARLRVGQNIRLRPDR